MLSSVRPLLLALVLVPLTARTAQPEYKWEKYEGCTLVENTWLDGDSFTVRIAPRKFRVFRLYFVDTPEDGKDQRFPARVAEQAAYFGVSQERAFKLGDEAATFTKKVLSAQPFTVWTLWQDALGSSKRQRFYALVEVEGRLLTSMLVEEGLARIYGKRIQLPDGTDSQHYLKTLAKAEEKARLEKKGAWGMTEASLKR